MFEHLEKYYLKPPDLPDQQPDYPRINQFLDYWDKNIDGPVKEAFIYDHEDEKLRVVDRRYKIN